MPEICQAVLSGSRVRDWGKQNWTEGEAQNWHSSNSDLIQYYVELGDHERLRVVLNSVQHLQLTINQLSYDKSIPLSSSFSLSFSLALSLCLSPSISTNHWRLAVPKSWYTWMRQLPSIKGNSYKPSAARIPSSKAMLATVLKRETGQCTTASTTSEGNLYTLLWVYNVKVRVRGFTDGLNTERAKERDWEWQYKRMMLSN